MFDRNKSIFFDAEVSETPIHAEPEVTTNTFLFNVGKSIVRKYNISIKYYDTDSFDPDRRIDYDVRVAIEPDPDQAGLWKLSFSKENLFINRGRPDLIVEELTARLMEVINPITVTVNNTLEIVHGIDNQKALLEKWPAIKEDILSRYDSFETNRLLEVTEENLANPWAFMHSLEQDMFWKAFFAPVYGTYNSISLERSQAFAFPARLGRYEYFEGIQRVEHHQTNYGTYMIKMDGSGGRSDSIKTVYNMELDSHLLKFIDIETSHSNRTFLRFSAYQIGRDEPYTSSWIESSDTQSEETPKKSFWSSLFR